MADSNRILRFRAWTTSENGKEMFQWAEHRHEISEWIGNEESGVTLMQYTGLKDKNGKEIYEGDIVHIVRMKTAPMANNGVDLICEVQDIRDCIQWITEKYTEVIGNIYEHGYLLDSPDRRCGAKDQGGEMNAKILKGFIRAERRWFEEWEQGEMSFGYLCQNLAEMIDNLYMEEAKTMLKVKEEKC